MVGALRNIIFSRSKSQMELDLGRAPEKDRNFEKGGRSFYFFDFDDNVAILNTPIFLFSKTSGQEMEISSGEYALHHKSIGQSGLYSDFRVDYDDSVGSFRAFRDLPLSVHHRLLGRCQSFVKDIDLALRSPEALWQGPSWSCFYHAVFNQRPISLITARGHAPETLKSGIKRFVRAGFLPLEPNYLSLYPVSHPLVRGELQALRGGLGETRVPELKQAAIRASVLRAFSLYGENPYHRFGMSDDDPKNLDLIIEEMVRLKRDFPKVSFFVISTNGGDFVKKEIFPEYSKERLFRPEEQMQLF